MSRPLASRSETAVSFAGGGSVTILTVTTMPGDDVTHPVPDNTGYITEGQLYLHGGWIDPFGSLSRLKQLVNRDTREDHRELMDTLVRLFASFRETREKRAMGFHMSDWDEKLLKYGERFEHDLMDLSVNIPLEDALDRGWQILADCFKPEEVGLRTALTEKFWPEPELPGPAPQEAAPGTATKRPPKKQASPAARESWHKTDPEVDSEIMRIEKT